MASKTKQFESGNRGDKAVESSARIIKGARFEEMKMYFRKSDEFARAKAGDRDEYRELLRSTNTSQGTANRHIQIATAIPNAKDRDAAALYVDRGALFELTKPKAPREALAVALRRAHDENPTTARVAKGLIQEQAKFARTAGVVELPDCVRIECCDFRSFDIKPASVDLILTDPPYDDASVPLYGEIARLAAQCLRPGGWCLAYAGKMYSARIHYRMKQHLSYGWTWDIVHQKATLIKSLRVEQNAKYVFGYRHEPGDAWWNVLSDRLEFPREKGLHPWQQPVAEAEYLIKSLCPAGGVVFDPMLGTGTTAIAAMLCGRQFVGCEIDPEMIRIASERIAKFKKAKEGNQPSH